MISALIGAVIMSGVTVAMLIAVKVTDEALSNVANYPLTDVELKILKDVKYSEDKIENFEDFIKDFKFD
tara:strand:- start:129 stop:335 length:207 start_codon:yes stop_codon:yes gene_type:complete